MPRTTLPSPTPLANGLVYVNPEMPGLRRFRQGEHFRFKDATGAWVRDPDEIARIRSLAIPPAYTDVWICPLPNGHLQATGLDARGRKQYRYHPDWRLLKDESKFERLEAFGSALPRIRARVVRDLGAGGTRSMLGRERVLATLVRLLDTTFMRVGNEEYASTNGSYGLTTLRNKHAAVRGGSLKLRFRGKSGVMHEAEVDDPRVAKVVRACQQLPGQDLFQYQDEDGQPRGLSSTDVNDYLRDGRGRELHRQGFPHLARHGAGAGADTPCLRQPRRWRRHAVDELQRQGDHRRGGAPARQHAGGLQKGLRAPRRARTRRDLGAGRGHDDRCLAEDRRPSQERAAVVRGRGPVAGVPEDASPAAGARGNGCRCGSGTPAAAHSGRRRAASAPCRARWSAHSRGLRPATGARWRRSPACAVRGALRPSGRPHRTHRRRHAAPAPHHRRLRPQCRPRRTRCREGSPAHRASGSAATRPTATARRPVRLRQ